MSSWSITPAAVADLGSPDAWALHGAGAVWRASELASRGHADLAYTPRYLAGRLHEQTYATRACLVVTPAGADPSPDAVVGAAQVTMPRQGNEHAVYVSLAVHPEQRRRGAGSALLDAVEALARSHDRSTVIAETDHPGEPPEGADGVLVAPTGAGRIRADDPGAAFALARGYALAQGERHSVLDLPVDAGLLTRLHDDAASHAGDAYRLVRWTGRTPDEHVDAFALLETRMSTDAPIGELDLVEDPWDADRIRVYEAQIARVGHGYLVLAAEHVASRSLAGFTMVEYPEDDPEVVFQEDTIVLEEHRGHRLGMLVKTALLRELPALRPQARRIHTWNAEENDHMLGINVALGFRHAGVGGEWQRVLPTS